MIALPPKVSAGTPVKASYHNAFVDAFATLEARMSLGGKYGRMPGYRNTTFKGAFPVKFKKKDGGYAVTIGAGNVHEGADTTYHIESIEKSIESVGWVSVFIEADIDKETGLITSPPTLDVLEDKMSPDCEGGDGKLQIIIGAWLLSEKTSGGKTSLVVDAEESIRYVNGDVWLPPVADATVAGDVAETAFRVWFTTGEGAITMHVGPGHVQGIGTKKFILRDGTWDAWAGDDDDSGRYDTRWVQSTPKGSTGGSTIEVAGINEKVAEGSTQYVVLTITRDADGIVSGAELSIVPNNPGGSENWDPAESPFTVLIGEYSDINTDEYGRVTYTSVRGLYGDYWYYPLPAEVQSGSEGTDSPSGGTSLRPLEYLGSPYAWTRTDSNEWTLANVIVYGALNYATAGWQTLISRVHLFTSSGCGNGVVQGVESLPKSGTTLCREKGNVLFSRLHDLAGVVVSVSNSSVPALVYLTITGTENGMSGQWGILTDLSNDKDKLPWNPQAFIQTFNACMSRSTSDYSYFDFRSCARNCASDFYNWTVTIPMALITSSAAGRNVLIPLHQGFVEARPTLYFASGAADKSSEMSPTFSSPSVSGSPSSFSGDPVPYIPSGVITDDDKIDEADAIS